MTFPSPFSLPFYTLFRRWYVMLSFTFNKIIGARHQPLLHAIRNIFVFVWVLQPMEIYVKCAALYCTFIPQSFWNTRSRCPRGRKFHLTQSLVAFGGWSSVRGRTNRKHCPSHEIWSYKGDGRWSGWSFYRGSTVYHWLLVVCSHWEVLFNCFFVAFQIWNKIQTFNKKYGFGWQDGSDRIAKLGSFNSVLMVLEFWLSPPSSIRAHIIITMTSASSKRLLT